MNRPVLILGSIPRIVVPIARSLCRRGVKVDVASFPSSPRIASNAIAESRNITPPHVDHEQFIEDLRTFIGERQHDMLIPADDWMLKSVLEHYGELSELLHLACPPPSVASRVLDKSATLAVAQRCGIPIPRTEFVESSSQVHDLFEILPFPWILKPAQKETRKESFKSSILFNADEVRKRFPVEQQFAVPMLVQEYCSGAGVGVEILLHHDECLAAFQHRRTKEAPDTGGVSVTAIAEAIDRNLLESSLALLHALRWQGVAMVEYKVNPNGRAVLMEVNGRYWGTLSLPIYAGIDFPLYQWELAHGMRPQIPKTYMVGTKWRWTTGYLQRLYGLARNVCYSDVATRLLRENLIQLPNDFMPSVHDATFTFSDPMPSLVDFLRALRDFIARRVKAVGEGGFSSVSPLAHANLLRESRVPEERPTL